MRLEHRSHNVLARAVGRLCRNESGGVAIYVALISVLMLGFGALVVDLGRLFTLQTELQNAADTAALSGAKELDGSSTAITRARLAAKNAFISNRQTFATGGSDVTFEDSNIRFLDSLPASDDDPITSSHVTTDPFQARFIEVTASTRNVNYLLAPVLSLRIGGDGSAPTSGAASAVAVAGNNQVTCNYPAFMMCNPAETAANPGAQFDIDPGIIIELVENGDQNATWAPGNFGLIDPPGQTTAGAPAVTEWIATAGTSNCLSSLVSQNTGVQVGPTEEGLNVRFDMFMGQFKNDDGRADLAPATNVTKGRYKECGGAGAGCGSYTFPNHDPANGLGMPTHTCYDSDTCAGLTSYNNSKFAPVLSDAEWADYWALNHDGLAFNTLAYTDSSVDLDGDGFSDPIDLDGSSSISRWEMYNWENLSGNIPDNTSPAGGNSDSSAENGNPKNYTGAGTASANRRIVSVAVMNCIDQNIKGNTSNSGKLIQPIDITKIFLVKPVPTASEGHAIFVEVAGNEDSGTASSPSHDIVQLYR